MAEAQQERRVLQELSAQSDQMAGTAQTEKEQT
jgi:hypothetical protein